MKTPSGKLKFAYETISKLETEINHQRCIITELVNALNPFIKACYMGCSEYELNTLRINAEKVIKSL